VSSQGAPYFLVLDTNVWVSERLLQSSLGSAILYALAADGASIILPEIVEMEVELVLARHADKAADELRKSAEFLRQISGHQKVFHAVPTQKAINDGIARRWKELGGAVIRAPFTIDHARSALGRILNHLPPSGENNEQFRDCCIWATVLKYSESRVVHFVTNDGAFYSGRDRKSIAPSLQCELDSLICPVKLHSSLSGFLEMVSHRSIDTLEKEVICDEIVNSVRTLAREIAMERASHSQRFELDEAKKLIIKGYATPKPSIIAIAFEVLFDLRLIDRDGAEERQTDTTLSLDGSCSYDPVKHETADVTVKSWNHRIRNGSHSGTMSLDPTFQDQMTQTRYV
jgi:hypothetical protein